MFSPIIVLILLDPCHQVRAFHPALQVLARGYAYHPDDFENMYVHVKSLLERNPDELHAEWQDKRKRFLDDYIDVTAFFTWFIENYPESQKVIKEVPNYQYRFK